MLKPRVAWPSWRRRAVCGSPQRRGAGRSAQDGLVALEDAFGVRLTHGTNGGRRAAAVSVDMWAASVWQQAIGTAVCPAYRATPAWRHAGVAVMQHREGLQESTAGEDHC